MSGPKNTDHEKKNDGRFGRAVITDDDMRLFYAHLEEGLEEYKGFGPLPLISHKDRYRRIFHLAYMAHYVHPEPDIKNIRDSKIWLLTYDERARWLVACPAEFCPPGIETLESIERRLEKAKDRMRKRALNYSSEFGEFAMKIRQGGLYLRHVGPAPTVLPSAWLVDKRAGDSEA